MAKRKPRDAHPSEIDGVKELHVNGLLPNVIAALDDFIGALRQDLLQQAAPPEPPDPAREPTRVTVRSRTRGLALTLVVEPDKDKE